MFVSACVCVCICVRVVAPIWTVLRCFVPWLFLRHFWPPSACVASHVSRTWRAGEEYCCGWDWGVLHLWLGRRRHQGAPDDICLCNPLQWRFLGVLLSCFSRETKTLNRVVAPHADWSTESNALNRKLGPPDWKQDQRLTTNVRMRPCYTYPSPGPSYNNGILYPWA